MTQPEAKFKKKLCEAYKEVFPKGFYFYFPAAVKYGVPDLYFTLGGRGVWVEAKVADNQPSKIQWVQIAKMRGAGERVLVMRLKNPDDEKKRRWVTFGCDGNEEMITYKYAQLKTDHFWSVVGG